MMSEFPRPNKFPRAYSQAEYIPGIHNQSWYPNDDYYPVGDGGQQNLLAFTPTGGINARTTTTFPHTFPSATCELVDPVTGDRYSPTRTAVIYNSTKIPISGSSIIQAKPIGPRYFVDVDDCS